MSIKCDTCGKELGYPGDGGRVVGFACYVEDLIDSPESKAYIKEQFGDYPVSGYNVCVECTLRAFNVSTAYNTEGGSHVAVPD